MNNQIQFSGQNQNNWQCYHNGENVVGQGILDYNGVHNLVQENNVLVEELTRAHKANLNSVAHEKFNAIQENFEKIRANLNRNAQVANINYNSPVINSMDCINQHNTLNAKANFESGDNINSNELYVKPPKVKRPKVIPQKPLVAPKLETIAHIIPDKSELTIANSNTVANRYSNIKPKNDTIFAPRMLDGVRLGEYYLNASGIKFNSSSTNASYVAAQAPLKSEFNSFFKAVVVGCSTIINLAMPVEEGKSKCDDYWSDEFWSQYGEKGLEIKDGNEVIGVLKKTEEDVCLGSHNKNACKSENKSKEQFIIERTFQFTFAKGNSRTIKQYHYQWWPDHQAAAFAPFQKLFSVLDKYASSDKPPMIHCSAGVGRTGTLIVADFLRRYMKDRYFQNKPISLTSQTIVSLIEKIRNIRSGMVQSQPQLDLVYSCANKYLNPNNLTWRLPRLNGHVAGASKDWATWDDVSES